MQGTNTYSIVVKVANIQVCRTFYRDILELGSPVLDSNFWVEFNVGDHLKFCLDGAQNGDLPEQSGTRISWICPVDDIEDVAARMKSYGYNPMHEEVDVMGRRVIQYHDPEGNAFYVSEEE